MSFLELALSDPEDAQCIAQSLSQFSFFPLDGAPAWLRDISRALPLRYLVDSMRDVMVRGKGPASALPAIGGLLLAGALVSLVAGRLFRWDDV